jgi:hypothetical protein
MRTRALILAAVLLLAPRAFAQGQECDEPDGLAESVYFTILDEADGSFGEVSDAACNAIVKKGVALCNAQVKAARKCYLRSIAAVYEIQLKQCKRIADPALREACKTGAKSDRTFQRQDVEEDTLFGLQVCAEDFVAALLGQCMGGPS